MSTTSISLWLTNSGAAQGTMDGIRTLAGYADTSSHGRVRFVISLTSNDDEMRFRLLTNLAFEAHDGTLLDQLRAREKECQIKSRALSEAERQLADKEAELTRLLGERALIAS
jgi:hypothetical protein